MLGGPGRELRELNLTDIDGLRVLKAAALYGANGSGKSNFVRALRAARSFVVHSATQMNLGDRIELMPFMLCKARRLSPAQFDFALVVDGIRYDYGFAATHERVHSEWIIAYPKGHARRWLERSYSPGNDEEDWICRGPLEGRTGKLLRDRTRPNALALSRAAEQSIQALAPLFLWFKNNLRVLDLSQSPEWLMSDSLSMFQRNHDFRRHLRELIADADMGISDVAVVERVISESDFPEEMPPEVRREVLRSVGDGPLLSWRLSHPNAETGERAHLPYELEAGGTQRLLALSGPFWGSVMSGSTLVVDELDCSLHSFLVRKLVELFQSPRFNRGGGQLIFTTHDTTLMDLSLFRRDQIWFAEKVPSGASRLYSLYDFEESGEKVRLGTAVQRRYMAGRYGGVPSFGPELDDPY